MPRSKIRGKGWVIFDLKTGRPYVPVAFRTQKMARDELRALLEPFAPSDPWRRRLKVCRLAEVAKPEPEPKPKPKPSATIVRLGIRLDDVLRWAA